MKTPNKIKNGLDHCAHAPDGLCKGCPYNDDCYIADGFSVIAHDALECIHSLENHISELTEKVAQLEAAQPKWISVKDRLPDNEVDVLICVERRHYSDPSKYIRFVVKAFHTDGRTNSEESSYVWSTEYLNMDYDEEADAYIIPEGWWESIEYGEEFSAVSDFVTHWKPLPEPPKEETPERTNGKDSFRA